MRPSQLLLRCVVLGPVLARARRLNVLCDDRPCDGRARNGASPKPAAANSSDECYTHDGFDYRGRTNVTADGTPCVEWSFFGLPGDDLGHHANCRNPDGKRRPWCFTHHRLRTWGYCAIAAPPSDEPCATRTHYHRCAPRCTTELLLNDLCDDECNVAACNYDMNRCGDTECYHDERGTDYRGTMFKTSQGRTCQNWRASYPHFHSYDDRHAAHGIGNHNFCRNPDNYSVPWCFTTDPDVRWEACEQVRLFQRPTSECARAEHRQGCARECANKLGDGTCDAECDRLECHWDGGDCDDIFLRLGRRFDVNSTRTHTRSQTARRYVGAHPVEMVALFLGMLFGMLALHACHRASLRRRRAPELYDDDEV